MLLKPSVRRRLYWSVAGVIALSVALILIADASINKATSDKVYDSVTEFPYYRVGLLLGTSKYLDSGRPNLYFKYRIDAAVWQEFHNRRAIYIATSLGVESTGYNARDVDKYNGFKTKLREKQARVKVFLDLAFGKEPRFLGERVELM